MNLRNKKQKKSKILLFTLHSRESFYGDFRIKAPDESIIVVKCDENKIQFVRSLNIMFAIKSSEISFDD